MWIPLSFIGGSTLIASLLIAGCSNPNDPAVFGAKPEPVISTAPTVPEKKIERTGTELYKAECGACHGPDGKTPMQGMRGNATNLASNQIQQKSDAELGGLIREGKPENLEMAGHPWLSDDEITRIIQHFRTFKQKR